MLKERNSRLIKKFMVMLFWLLAWEAASLIAGLPFLLPGPLSTIQKMIELWGEGDFWISLIYSFFRVFVGYTLALVFGVGLAILCSRFPLANELLSPIKSIIRSTPISSIIILVLLWLSVEATPVFIGFIAVMPIVWQDVQEGIRQMPADLIEMGQAYSFSRKKTIKSIYIPSILPYFYSACASGIGFAWKACIAAEVIARPLHSVGKNLQDAKVYLQTDELFAWTETVVLLSMVLEAGIKHALRASHSMMNMGEKE